MWKRRQALKLFVVSSSAPKRRSRLRRIRPSGWMPARAAAHRRSARSRRNGTPDERRVPDTAVLEQDPTAFVEVLEVPTSGAVYRLHSRDHYVSCSKARYEHLSALQRDTPVRVTAKSGRRWWWYRDRFWWVDGRLSAREIETTVLTLDLESHCRREAFEQAKAGLVGRNGASAEDALPDAVRREVWIRDRGRCVDCGIDSGLAFDHVLPVAVGGADTVPNLELRCRQCQLRRRDNEGRATVGKAQIGAHAAKEWGVELKDQSWPS
jgi:HNH endonuclease